MMRRSPQVFIPADRLILLDEGAFRATEGCAHVAMTPQDVI
jgi:hypothetical protein